MKKVLTFVAQLLCWAIAETLLLFAAIILISAALEGDMSKGAFEYLQ